VPDLIVAFIILAFLHAFPLFMGLLAIMLATIVPSSGSSRASSIAWAAFWPTSIIGVLELAIMTYALDPFGLNPDSFWVAEHDRAPLIGPGLYMMYIGVFAVLVGEAGLRWLRRSRAKNQGAA
jgi:hypothetical protein